MSKSGKKSKKISAYYLAPSIKSISPLSLPWIYNIGVQKISVYNKKLYF
jgi:hypothetical protein